MSEAQRDWPDTPADEPKPRQISWLWLLLGILIVGGFLQMRGGLVSPRGMGIDHPAVGHTLPDLQLAALTGDSQDVKLADLAGDVTVINFWGTWCPPCRAEFPEIAAVWAQLKSKEHFRLFAVSCEDDDSDLAPLREKTKAFLEQQQSQLPTYADRDGFSRRNVAMALGETGFGYPTTLVLDQKGVIRAVWIGYDSQIADQIKQLVDQLLKAEA